MSALDELKKINPVNMTMLEFVVTQAEYSEVSGNAEHAAAELAALKARVKQAEENWHKNEARVAKLQKSIKDAKIQLEATQRNWDEDCLYRCNDILVDALKGAE